MSKTTSQQLEAFLNYASNRMSYMYKLASDVTDARRSTDLAFNRRMQSKEQLQNALGWLDDVGWKGGPANKALNLQSKINDVAQKAMSVKGLGDYIGGAADDAAETLGSATSKVKGGVGKLTFARGMIDPSVHNTFAMFLPRDPLKHTLNHNGVGRVTTLTSGLSDPKTFAGTGNTQAGKVGILKKLTSLIKKNPKTAIGTGLAGLLGGAGGAYALNKQANAAVAGGTMLQKLLSRVKDVQGTIKSMGQFAKAHPLETAGYAGTAGAGATLAYQIDQELKKRKLLGRQ